MALAALIWIVTLATLALAATGRWWLPPGISQHAAQFDSLLHVALWACGGIFVIAQFTLGWAILKHRDDGGAPVTFTGNNKLELLWTAATAILFLGLAIGGIGVWAGVHLNETPRQNAMVVEVLAKQFSWNFRYPGPDAKFGRTAIQMASDSSGNPFGIDEKDTAGKDDIVTGALRVPAGVPVELRLQSRDVIHNFFVRELRLKQDVVPGMIIPLRFQADKPGTYEVPCSELCGLGHHQMRTTLIVMPRDEFEPWLRGAGQQQ